MSERFETAVEHATKILLEAVGLALRPEDATAAAVAKLFPASILDGKDGGNSLTLRALSADERQLLDQAARAVLASMVSGAVTAGVEAMTWQLQPGGPPAVPRLLNMFLLTSEQKFMDPGLVFGLLEDLVETITITECEGVFTYLEEHAAALGRPRAKQSGKHHMLRTCNQLLRRLSKGHNAVLCGRILIFLARLLPLSDRSGINLQGAYNTANTTPIEDVPEGALDSNGERIDAAFYRRFWGLQAAFQAPAASMRPGPWAGVVADLQAVLAEFQAQKTVVAARGAPDAASGELPAVKYLSSPKLMRLQLQDAAFRRHVLVQALVFLHACRHPGRLQKEALKSKQLEEAAALETALHRQLEATPECGAEFAAAIRTVLEDETHWSNWKKEGRGPKNETCFPFERPAYVPPQPPEPAAQPPARKRQRAEAPGTAPRVRVGTAALDRLWNQAPTNMSGLKVQERKHLPTLREFLDPVIEDMDPDNCIEDEFRRKHDKVYQWKALRMISRESLPIFTKTVVANDLEEAARGFFPSEVPAKPVPEASTSGGATQATADATVKETPSSTAAAQEATAVETDAAADKALASRTAASKLVVSSDTTGADATAAAASGADINGAVEGSQAAAEGRAADGQPPEAMEMEAEHAAGAAATKAAEPVENGAAVGS